MPVDSQIIGIIVVKCSIFQQNRFISDASDNVDAEIKPAISDGLYY